MHQYKIDCLIRQYEMRKQTGRCTIPGIILLILYKKYNTHVTSIEGSKVQIVKYFFKPCLFISFQVSMPVDDIIYTAMISMHKHGKFHQCIDRVRNGPHHKAMDGVGTEGK